MPHPHAPKKVAIIGAGPSGLVTAKTLLHHNAPRGLFLPTIFEKSPRIGGLWAAPATDGADTARDGGKTHRDKRGFVNPSMRTNLSRYTVAFSDLGWEEILPEDGGDGGEVPMFPQARQVRRYLEVYAERFLLREGVVRFGCEVTRVERGDAHGAGWVVEWVQAGDDTGTQTERFDYLVVASGYFARPVGPDIPGFEGRMVHSSAVQEMRDVQGLLERAGCSAGADAGGKLVVVGGSMSGVEAASAVALHLSSSAPGHAQLEVHHICSRPFWTVPTYLPRISPDQAPGTAVPFLPLDLVFYDRARRPPGQIEYAVGPLAPDQISRSNAWFRQLLGSEYARIGSVGVCPEDSELQPSWVAIGNDYAEYVRAGAVKVTIGRVAHLSSSNDRARLAINLPTGETSVLDNVAAIILATGFTPRDSLAFLPPSILSTLEYAPDDAFIPLILDNKGTSHSEIPDLGFVGFYRGPYWGVMEMQARSLAARWSTPPAEYPTPDHSPRIVTIPKETEPETEREKLRRLRNQTRHRSQFPMGDYVGLMESFARELGIPRLPIPSPSPNPDSDSAADQQNPLLDPVIPARYPYPPASSPSSPPDNLTARTLISLATTLPPIPSTVSTGEAPTATATATATAIFRALHGAWHFARTTTTTTTTTTRPHKNEPSASIPEPEPLDNKTESPTTGSALFKPRYTTLPGYEREYLYTETETETDPQPQDQAPSRPPRPITTEPSRSSDSNTTPGGGVKQSVYRLLGDGDGGSALRDSNRNRGARIHVWDWDCDAGTNTKSDADIGSGVKGDEGSRCASSSSSCQKGRVRGPPAERFSHSVRVSQASLGGGGFDRGDEHEQKDAGGNGSGRRWYRICGIGENTDGWGGATWEYTFYLEGVSIIRWECVSAIELESGRKLTRKVYLR
ncbi:hypothetical protein ASPACDRAFT_42849 [Aspergillus aculeatus ATCC 16872]|uniref:FAD/NAD(P)-binding domain-containing protein n=1 Tax=Aspergillus aculeatus (strain ATCC 16872 / CBS 172.66 / WB 5094) TaxID=690307 RepID=A0A1L9WVV2_ASPA1|nr:uncharacterized protein ASPACDRAFT_42849 [Aspergillus aculeatus ATCC 16872]OJK00264.1 hypothetical protein ASPACDRAFT_42849 [Aspergillus aculeatus ATCC 16872]